MYSVCRVIGYFSMNIYCHVKFTSKNLEAFEQEKMYSPLYLVTYIARNISHFAIFSEYSNIDDRKTTNKSLMQALVCDNS